VSVRRNIALVAFVGAVGLAIVGIGSMSLAASRSSVAIGSGRAGTLGGVSADSATDAWAVGYYGPFADNPPYASETLALRWNGTSWSKVASPNPGGTTFGKFSYLTGVSARSTNDAWAVGSFIDPTTHAQETLVLRWNGTSWSKVTSPNPGGTSASGDRSSLTGVSADSTNDAWAVGYYSSPTTGAVETLVLHGNGASWSKVTSPNPGGTTSSSDLNYLDGISADSPTDAWAVGSFINPTTHAQETLVLRWNGTSWSKVTSPNPGGTRGNGLNAVSARSTSDVWAVGNYASATTQASQTLVLHWNGTRWSKVTSPNPDASTYAINILSGVSARSATDAWAVGSYGNPTSEPVETLVLHWNSPSWGKVTSPNPDSAMNVLNGVTARSATDAWAVGSYNSPTVTLVLRWNGTSWSKA